MSRAVAAKRALIAALKSLARAHGVPRSLTQDADDAAVRAAQRGSAWWWWLWTLAF